MHKLQMYEGLRDMLEREVTEIEKKGDLTEPRLDNLYKLMTALKVTDKCIEREEDGSSYESRRSYGRGGRSNDGSYERSNEGRSQRSYDGMSNRMMPDWAYDSYDRRSGRDNDNDGRYSEDNFRSYTNRGRSNQSRGSYEYSRDNSRKKMVQKLETLMDDTMSENERQAIMDCINRIQ